jgi:hypothetical protein
MPDLSIDGDHRLVRAGTADLLIGCTNLVGHHQIDPGVGICDVQQTEFAYRL